MQKTKVTIFKTKKIAFSFLFNVLQSIIARVVKQLTTNNHRYPTWLVVTPITPDICTIYIMGSTTNPQLSYCYRTTGWVLLAVFRPLKNNPLSIDQRFVTSASDWIIFVWPEDGY